MSSDAKIEAKSNFFVLGVIELKLEGAGYGDLVALMFNVMTKKFMQDKADLIIEDFKATANTNE